MRKAAGSKRLQTSFLKFPFCQTMPDASSLMPTRFPARISAAVPLIEWGENFISGGIFMPRNRRTILKSLALGLLTAVFITLVCMLLLAAALVYLRFGDQLLTILNQILKLASIVAGVCVAVPRGGERGLATGALISLFYMAAGYALYVALGGGSFAVGNMLGEMMLGSAAGAVTGAVRANLSPARSPRAAKA